MENSDEMKKPQQNLKHLGFVRVAAINTFVWLSSAYDYAKRNSGPLRSAVDTVEGAVSAAITPVYTKFKDVPDHLLVVLDEKVDAANAKYDEHAPPLVKQVASQAHIVLEKTTQVAKELVHRAQLGGPLEAAKYVANESKQVAVDQSVKVWSKLDELPPFHMMAEMVIPTAAHLTEKYKQADKRAAWERAQCFQLRAVGASG